MGSETARLWHRHEGGRKVQLDWYMVDTLEELPAFDAAIMVREVGGYIIGGIFRVLGFLGFLGF